ncbi:MAG: hypothetical protein P8Q40_04865 [Candidatus Poseidonia sp.]|uniref:hypothetical protein n=1 Tax=Poseidonia sp. TaxID=2666344 RepID=UPI0030C3E9E5|nr:hypothetical protein [Poseidonia sp.]
MKNMTPMILGLLMLTSFFAGIDFTELEETVVIEDAGARAGADPSVLAITTPKETICDTTGCRNELKVGEGTNFAAYIQNIGDASVDELTYTVTVYLTDSSGAVGMIAKDPTGNDLQWENLDAICDDGSVCDFDSSATPHPFTANSYLGGGKYTLKYAGQDILWTPTQGIYIVEIAVDSPTDADIANNAQQIEVSVTDWYDIKVELEWDDGTTSVTGSDPAGFTLTVLADGSTAFSPRDVEIRLALTGVVQSATGGLNNDNLTLNGGITTLMAGTSTPNTLTFQNETDVNDTTSATRTVLDYQSAWTYTGLVTPDAQQNTSKFVLDASVLGYTSYGQFPDCVETFEDAGNVTTWSHFCEVAQSGDDRPATDYTEITGAVENYHDIRISRMGVYQGYNSDGTGQSSNFVEDSAGADLNVGASRIYAEVQHRGSNPMVGYDWNVSYTVSLGTTVVDSGTLTSCMEGTESPYEYQPLGGPGPEIGSVCTLVTLEPGEYTFEFDLVMANKPTSIDATGAFDMRTSNNDRTMVSNVVNNLPLITSFELVTQGDLVVGQEDMLQFAVTAFDVDDPSGEGLNFAYNIPGGTIPGCGGTQSTGGTVCTAMVLAEYVTIFPVTVVVTDNHGGEVSQEMILSIWNNAIGTDTTASGIEVTYPIQYFLQSNFTISVTDGDVGDYADVELEGFAGKYDAVAVVDYVPSTTFTTSDILTQSLSVSVDKSLEATSLWYIDGSGKWIVLDDTSEDSTEDATKSVFTYTIPANSPVIPTGTMVLMGGELVGGELPTAAISNFAINALKGGAIGMSWDFENLPLRTGDNVRLIITDGTTDVVNQTVPSEDRTYTLAGPSTTHGTTYSATIAVCNLEGCSTPGIGEAIADKRVEGDVSATNLRVEQDGDNWVVKWDVTGDSSDVAMWHVCYQRTDDFDAANMPTNCPDMVMGASGNTVTIAQPTTAGSFTYYFTAVPMDALENMNSAASMNSIDYYRQVANDNADGNGTIGDDADSTGGSVPAGAWAAIAGVIIVAFVVGAFILTRGDGEGGEGAEDGKDWDY